ncbi:hypothetical protein BDW66DRAFT_129537 [Aspergillus desertorum]
MRLKMCIHYMKWESCRGWRGDGWKDHPLVSDSSASSFVSIAGPVRPKHCLRLSFATSIPNLIIFEDPVMTAQHHQVVELRYLDEKRLMNLLRQRFKQGEYSVRLSCGRYLISVPKPLSEEDIDSCRKPAGQ